MLAVEGTWIWDCWFADAGDAYHVFYLQAPQALGDPDLRHLNASVGHAVSDDLTTWTVLPDALQPGPPGSFDDLATWTGSVIANGDGWSMFYTGLSAGRVQRIGVAESDDLISWRKHPANPLLESDSARYEPGSAGEGQVFVAWRDPWVYGRDGEFHMLITARDAAEQSRFAGVVGQARSPDLLTWELEAPLTTPSDFAELEVPQLVEIEGRAVLIFSCGSPGLSARRLAEPGGGGSYYLLVDDDPTSSEYAVALNAPGLYACRIVWNRNGDPHLIGFVDRDRTGAFGGTLSDPIPLRKAAPALFDPNGRET